jgi:ParB-like chromosome segregation protein Spo0J
MNSNPNLKGTIMEFHEFADIFPMLSEEELAELCADIKKNGLTDPVTLYEGKVLDGRNRATACEKLGINPKTVKYTGDDPLGFVLSKNLHRRHLTTGQRSMIAEKLATLSEGRPKKTVENSTVSTETAAKTLNVSRDSVQQARKVRTKAVPEVAEAVEAGKMPVSVAAKLADAPPEEQREAVAKVKRGEKHPPAKKQQSPRKTVAKGQEPDEDFIEQYMDWLNDPVSYEMPRLDQNEEYVLRLPLPLDHKSMLPAFRDVFGQKNEAVRNRVIAEVKILADLIDNLND